LIDLDDLDAIGMGPPCPECGDATDWLPCWNCGGEGFHEDLHEMDPLWYDPDETEPCYECKEKGGWWRWLVCTYSNVGERILDPFMGSGSTGEAALIELREFVGYEIDDEYFQVAKKRLDETARILRKTPKTIKDEATYDDLPLFDGL